MNNKLLASWSDQKMDSLLNTLFALPQAIYFHSQLSLNTYSVGSFLAPGTVLVLTHGGVILDCSSHGTS